MSLVAIRYHDRAYGDNENDSGPPKFYELQTTLPVLALLRMATSSNMQYHIVVKEWRLMFSPRSSIACASKSVGAWFPILPLDRTDVTMSLFLLTGYTTLYGAPVTDPFSVQPYQSNFLPVRTSSSPTTFRLSRSCHLPVLTNTDYTTQNILVYVRLISER